MTIASDVSPVYDLDRLRDKFAITRTAAYLNHAGLSPLADPVRQAMIEAVEAMASSGSQVYADLLDPLEDLLPRQLARLINAQPTEITFTTNTSLGINTVAHSLPLKAGDNVLLCDVEFPANVYPWMNLGHKGIETRLVPSVDGGLSIDTLEHWRDTRSRVVAVSAVQFFTGHREDLFALGRYCADHGLWLIVDAIQAAGIVPLDVKAMNIQALVSGGQKALMGPPGQGFMYIHSDLNERMVPIFAGATSVTGFEHWLRYEMTPRPGASRHTLGTLDIAGMAGLLAAVELLLDLGVENISEWVTYLSNIAIEDLTARGYRVVTPVPPAQHANIVTFAYDRNPLKAVERLAAGDVILRPHQDAAGAYYLRISSHCYNTPDEVLRVGDILGENIS